MPLVMVVVLNTSTRLLYIRHEQPVVRGIERHAGDQIGIVVHDDRTGQSARVKVQETKFGCPST